MPNRLSNMHNRTSSENLSRSFASYRNKMLEDNATITKQLATISQTLTNLEHGDIPKPTESNARDRETAIMQLKEEKVALTTSASLLGALVVKSDQAVKVADSIGKQWFNFGDRNWGMQVGSASGDIHFTPPV